MTIITFSALSSCFNANIPSLQPVCFSVKPTPKFVHIHFSYQLVCTQHTTTQSYPVSTPQIIRTRANRKTRFTFRYLNCLCVYLCLLAVNYRDFHPRGQQKQVLMRVKRRSKDEEPQKACQLALVAYRQRLNESNQRMDLPTT